MCAGIAVCESELSILTIQMHDLNTRRVDRGGTREFQFLWAHPDPVLPVLVDGQGSIVVAKWGARARKSKLPPTGWTWRESVEAGKWASFSPTPVVIVANLGLERGVWYRIRQGIHGLMVRDENDEPRVYMICEPPTRYYQVMTRSDRMPSLVDEMI